MILWSHGGKNWLHFPPFQWLSNAAVSWSSTCFWSDYCHFVPCRVSASSGSWRVETCSSGPDAAPLQRSLRLTSGAWSVWFNLPKPLRRTKLCSVVCNTLHSRVCPAFLYAQRGAAGQGSDLHRPPRRRPPVLRWHRGGPDVQFQFGRLQSWTDFQQPQPCGQRRGHVLVSARHTLSFYLFIFFKDWFNRIEKNLNRKHKIFLSSEQKHFQYMRSESVKSN